MTNQIISIHALRYRVRYLVPDFSCALSDNFNPRTPLQSAMGVEEVTLTFDQLFQSTHSVTECDRKILWFKPKIQLFYAILRLKKTNHASQMSPNET